MYTITVLGLAFLTDSLRMGESGLVNSLFKEKMSNRIELLLVLSVYGGLTDERCGSYWEY